MPILQPILLKQISWYSLSNYVHDVHDVMKMAELDPRAL